MTFRVIALLVGTTLWVSYGAAQSVPGGSDGIKVGDGRLHPYVEAETHYVVHPGYASGAPNDAMLAVRPGLDLDVPSEKIDLKFSGDLEYQQYLGLGSSQTLDYSGLMGHGSILSSINRQGSLGLRLREEFTRSAGPSIMSGGRLLHFTNDVGFGLDVRPGGGALTFSADYSLFWDRYDRGGNSVPDPANLDNMRHNPKLRALWKFLPKTAVFLEAEGYLTQFYDFKDPDPTGPTVTKSDVNSNIFLVQLGAAGSITSRISALVKAGYGNTFMAGPDNFNSFVGQAELHYAFTETTGFKAGLLRTVQPASLFKYFALNRFYVGCRQAFTGKIQGDLTLSYDDQRFPRPAAGPQHSRRDGDLLADIGLNYQVTEWLNVALMDRIDWRTSTYENGAQSKDAYARNDLFLRVGFRY